MTNEIQSYGVGPGPRPARVPVKLLDSIRGLWSIELAGETYTVKDSHIDDATRLMGWEVGPHRFRFEDANGDMIEVTL